MRFSSPLTFSLTKHEFSTVRVGSVAVLIVSIAITHTAMRFRGENKIDAGICRHESQLPGKKGIGMRLREAGQEGSWEENLPKLISLKPYWNYSWSLKRIDAQPADIEFIPMVWGGYWTVNSLRKELQSLLHTGNVQRILAFNEPDRKEQSSMDVKNALELWPALQETGLSIVSPSCASPSGKWMTEFMELAFQHEYRVDYVGVHWYGQPNSENFKSKMKAYHQLYRKPLLISEFAPADWKAHSPQENRYTRAIVLAFMKEILPWLENQEWIIGYSWFPFPANSAAGTCSALFKRDGTLTALGQFYASVSNEKPEGNQSIVAWM